MNKMDQGEESSSEIKQRMIPKLTPERADRKSDKNGKQQSVDKKQETPEERIERINNTKITVSDFFVKCIDHDMLKLFFTAMFLFFFAVGMLACCYVFFIFCFQEKMWNAYFPSERVHKNAHGEL